jgi:uncharacterized protein
VSTTNRNSPIDPRLNASPALPWAFDGTGKTAAVSGAAKVKQFIEAYLFTNLGERVNRPTYGAGIVKLVFAGVTQVEQTLRQGVESGLNQELFDLIEITAVESQVVESAVRVTVRYRLRVPDGAGRLDQQATFLRPLGT